MTEAAYNDELATCRCGHSKTDHLGGGRCDEGRKRCMCVVFQACDHPSTTERAFTYPKPGARRVCTVCRHVVKEAA